MHHQLLYNVRLRDSLQHPACYKPRLKHYQDLLPARLHHRQLQRGRRGTLLNLHLLPAPRLNQTDPRRQRGVKELQAPLLNHPGSEVKWSRGEGAQIFRSGVVQHLPMDVQLN